jgi:hypothetical protein
MKVSVAPMMDWTDAGDLIRRLRYLCRLRNHRSLYVASQLRLWASRGAELLPEIPTAHSPVTTIRR